MTTDSTCRIVLVPTHIVSASHSVIVPLGRFRGEFWITVKNAPGKGSGK